jgi:hypothetical protein
VRWLATLLLLGAVACQAPARPAAPPTPSPAPASPAAAPPTGTGRVELLNAASGAYRAGDARAAGELYERVLNTPPTAGESAELTRALDDLAHFRAMLALVASGDESGARAHLEALRERDPNAPLARLAAQFWDQYGMTAQLRAACAQLQPQLAQAAPTLATLAAAGVTLQSDALCAAPGS